MATTKKNKKRVGAKGKAKAKKAAPSRKPAAKPARAPKRASKPAVVHWEVQARDPERQQAFFSSLFGWTIDANNPMGYGMVPSGGREAINGGIGGTDGEPRVTVYVQVDDIVGTLTRAEALGGQTILPRTDVGMVVMAQFRDPEGNVIGVIEG